MMNLDVIIMSLTEIAEQHTEDGMVDGVNQQTIREALELLTEQKSEWLEDSDPGQEYGTTWACRKCMHSIHKPYIWNPYESKMEYCPFCGRKMVVKLDG